MSRIEDKKRYLQEVRSARGAPSMYKYMDDKVLSYHLKKSGQMPSENIRQSTLMGPSDKDRDLDGKNDLSFLERWADWGITEDSWDWAKSSYNRSLTGLTEKMVKGTARYDVDETDFTVLEDIGASLFSFFMPLDLITMSVGGGAGGVLAKKTAQTMVKNKAYKKFGKKITDEVIEKGGSLPKNFDPSFTKVQKAILGGVGQAPALGAYEAAIGGVQAKIDGENVMNGVGYGLLHGSALGAVTGGIGGGMGARAAEILKAGKKAPLGKGDWLKARIGYGLPGQTVTEAGVFTIDEHARAVENGDDHAGNSFLESWGRNIGMFGALKAYGFGKKKAAEKVGEIPLGKAIKEHTKAWRERILKAELEADKSKTKNSLENVSENLKESGIDVTAVEKEIGISRTKNKEVGDLLRTVEKSMEGIDKLVDAGNPKAIEGSGKKIADIVNTIKLAEEILKKGEKGELTDVQFNINNQQRKSINSIRKKLSEIEGSFDKSFNNLGKKSKKESRWEEDVDVVSGMEIPRSISGPDKGRWFRTKEGIKSIPTSDIISVKSFDSYPKGLQQPAKGETQKGVLFHVTPTKNIPIIKKEGITADPKRTPLWNKAKGGKYGEGEVYAFENLNDALGWAQKMEFDLNIPMDKISIVKIKKDAVSKKTPEVVSKENLREMNVDGDGRAIVDLSGVDPKTGKVWDLNKPDVRSRIENEINTYKNANKPPQMEIPFGLDKAREKAKQDIEAKRAQQEYLKDSPLYNKIKKGLQKDFGKVKSDKALNKIAEYSSSISEGKVKPNTMPKEVSNNVVSILKEMGSAKDKALMNKGIKMFSKGIKKSDYKNQSEFVKAQENALLKNMNQFASGNMKNKTSIAKAKNFSKDFWNRVNESLEFATKDDISWMLSRKKSTAKTPTVEDVNYSVKRNEVHHKLNTKGGQSAETLKEKNIANSVAHKYENKILRDLDYTRKDLDAIRGQYEIPVKGRGFKVAEKGLGNMREWGKHLEDAYKTGKNKIKEIEDLAKQYKVSKLEQESVARLLGEHTGKVSKLTPENREHFKLLIKNHGKEPVNPMEPGQTSMQAISELSDMPNTRMLAKKIGLPVYYMLRESGTKSGKVLADKFIKFDVTYVNEYKGKGDLAASDIRKLLKKDVKNIWMFDGDMVQAYKNSKHAPKLTKSELSFLKSMKKEGSNINLAKKRLQGLMDFYWNGVAKEAKVLYNPKEYAKFKKEFSNKFVQDYFTRRLTKEAKGQILDYKNTDALLKDLQRAVEKQSEMMALEKFPNKNSKKHKDYLKKLRDPETVEGGKLRDKATENLVNIVTHQHHLVESSYLKERGPLLDPFMEITKANGQKKIIRTYENTMSTTIDPYIMGMSKYIATLRHFPEYTGIGKKYKLNEAGLDRFNLAIKNKPLAKYADDAIKKLIGIEDPARKYESVLQDISSVSAAIGLSSPTSGVKNILIGLPRNIATYGALNTSAGIVKAFSSTAWKQAREKGALGFTPTTLEIGGAQFQPFKNVPGLKWVTMENLFRGNGMNITENFNRIVAMEAGKMYFAQQVNILKGKPDVFGVMGTKNNATRVLKDVYKLSDKDIGLVLKGELKTKEDMSRYNQILRQVEHYSHISTQGGTSVGQLPLWMSSKAGRPLTLFQRIAYSTTHDTVQNYVKPAMRGNIAPLARATIGHYLGGATLYTMYKALFNEESPESSSDAMSKAFFYVNRSEMLGLMGFVYDPYDRGVTSNLMTPVIYRNAQLGGEALWNAVSGERTLGQAVKEFSKQSIVLYSQADKFKRNVKSKEWMNARMWNSRMSQFKDDYGIENNWDKNKKNYYYHDLKESLYFGSNEDIAKTFFAAYGDLLSQSEFRGSTAIERHKDAMKRIKMSLKSLNPLSISEQTSKGKIISKKSLYLRWVREKYGQAEVDKLLKAERQYEYLLRKFQKVVSDEKLWEKYSVYGKKFPI